MHETILIEFQRGGEIVPVTDFSADPKDGGITLGGETSSFPRGYGLSVTPANAVTKEKVWRVQQRLGWLNNRDFRLNLSRNGKRLRLTGVDADALPPGRYDIEFVVSGFRLKRSEFRNVRVPKDDALELVCEEKPPKYKFELNTNFGGFDADAKTLLKASEIDGRRADRWLQPSVRHQDLRKACLLNILAKLAIVPSRDARLNRLVNEIFFVEVDRVYAQVDRAFLDTLRSDFLPREKNVHSTHKRLLNTLPGETEDYILHSHRENKGRGALQAVVAVPKASSNLPQDKLYADIDIDGSNPSYDLSRFLMHAGHILRGTKTDHFKIRKKIAARTGDFLYYNAVKV